MRLPVEIGTSARLECGVAGCGWSVAEPILYRIEADTADGPIDTATGAFARVRVVPDRPAGRRLDALLAEHLEAHALAETGLEHPDDPGPTP